METEIELMKSTSAILAIRFTLFVTIAARPELTWGGRPDFATDTGSRAFTVRPLTVPLRLTESDGVTRAVPAGSIVKLCTFRDSKTALAYDDAGTFEVQRGDFVLLSANLDACLAAIGDADDFTRAFASGNYYLNQNLARARSHFQRALDLRPADPHATLGLAPAQSTNSEKRRHLDMVPVQPRSIRLLAETHRARLDSDLTAMERISGDHHAPSLVWQEMLAFYILRAPHLATPEKIQPIGTSAYAYWSTPRLLNLNAMLLRSDILKDVVPFQERVDGALRGCRMAMDVDPYYYHAHMTLGEIFLSGNHPAEAVTHFDAALRLNPVQLEALRAYSKAELHPKFNPTTTDDPLLTTSHDLRALYEQLKTVRNNDLPQDTVRAKELFLHGFLPVNHGETQPAKIHMLKQQNFAAAVKYLKETL